MFWSCCFPVVWASGKYKTKSVGSCKSSFPVDSGTKTHILELEIWDVLPAHKSGVNFITENQPARKKIFLYWKYWINFTVRGMIWNGLSILSFCETTKEKVRKVRIAMFTWSLWTRMSIWPCGQNKSIHLKYTKSELFPLTNTFH